jgi:hypothetical protein
MFLEHLEQDILRNAIRLPALMNYFAGLLPKSPDA